MLNGLFGFFIACLYILGGVFALCIIAVLVVSIVKFIRTNLK